MAKEPIVKVEGSRMDKILTVSHGIANRADADGRPTKNMRPLGIQIQRIVDGTSDVTAWAERTGRDSRKDGSIEFFYNDGKSMKTLEWVGGYVQDYDISYDQSGDHAVEQFTIVPEKITVGGTEIDYKWEEHN